MTRLKFLSAIGIALCVGLGVGMFVPAAAGQNKNAVALPTLPTSANAAPTAISLATPWNVQAVDGGTPPILSDLTLTVGYQDNAGVTFRRTQTFLIHSDNATTVTATETTNGANTVVAWTQPANAVTRHQNALDYLNTIVIKLNAAGVLVPITTSNF